MDLKAFLMNQKAYAEEYKYYKGIELGHDPGEAAVIEWIQKNGKKYREEYNEVLDQLINQCAQNCLDRLKEKVPGVSPELWDFVFKEIIESFTKEWTKEVCCEKNESRRIHITEI